MPYFTSGTVIGPNPDEVALEDFPSSTGASLSASVEDAWKSNPVQLGYDYLSFRAANSGEKVDNEAAKQSIKQAGLSLSVPDGGYTAEALDLLISRKQDEIRRQDTLARAPTGFLPTSTRFTASLLTSIVDPINVASAFVPVYGEARVASMLARAGNSALSRAATRAGIGGVEGAVGAAALEPFAYGIRTQLQDDYSMADSLLNVAFGAGLGSTLHVGVGAIGDAIRVGRDPNERFAGLAPDEVQAVMNFERERASMAPEDRARVIDSFTPGMRTAAGNGADPMSAASIDARISPELRETAVRAAIADFSLGRAPDVEGVLRMDADFTPNDLGQTTSETIGLLEQEREALLPDAGQLAEKGAIREARKELAALSRQEPDVSDTALKARAKEIQAADGISYKAALSRSNKEADARLLDYAQKVERLQSSIEANAKAQQATQRVGEIDRQIEELRARLRNTPPIPTLDSVRATAEKQARPEAVSIADFFAARAADQRIADAPKGDAIAIADEQLARATERLESVAENLRLGGYAPERLQAALDELAPFDEAVNDAQSLSKAVQAAALCGTRS